MKFWNRGILLFFTMIFYVFVMSMPAVGVANENEVEFVLDKELQNQEKKQFNQNIQRLKREAMLLKRTIEMGFAVKVPVLMYHHIVSENHKKYQNNNSVISEVQFREQMDWLKEQDYITITPEELYEFAVKEAPLPSGAVLITFDDGYKSNVEIAYPILKRNGQKAAIFVIGRSIEKESQGVQNPYKKQESLTYADMERTRDVFEFHSHTYDLHKMVRGIPVLLREQREWIQRDFDIQAKWLQSSHFAYPFGKYNESTLEILQEKGFKTGYTIQKGYVTRESFPLELPRFGITPNLSMEAFEEILTGEWKE